MHVVFGKYKLLKRLSRGGMAELYLAHDTGGNIDRIVVIKVIASRFCKDATFMAMFQDEARIAARLSHPNIGQVLEAGEVDKKFYLAMEYLHGRDLFAVIQRCIERGHRGVPPHIAVQIGARICSALQYAHTMRGIDGKPLHIVHRDVSPSNIMITYDGAVKLIDFGIAKAANRLSLTEPGSVKGKVRYLAPEQMIGQAIDHRCDIFTLGISLWEATVGEHLFDAETDVGVYQAIREGKIRKPSTIIADYPKPLEAILLQALSKHPQERFSSAREFQQALELYAHHDGISLSDLELSRFMHENFSTEMSDWHAAEERGQSLATYLESSSDPEHRDLQLFMVQEDQRATEVKPVEFETGDNALVIKQEEIARPSSQKKTELFGEFNVPFAVSKQGVSLPKVITRPPISSTSSPARIDGPKSVGRETRTRQKRPTFDVANTKGLVLPSSEAFPATSIPRKARSSENVKLSENIKLDEALRPTLIAQNENQDRVSSAAVSEKKGPGPAREVRIVTSAKDTKESASTESSPKKQTGDWGLQERDFAQRRPGTHPYFSDEPISGLKEEKTLTQEIGGITRRSRRFVIVMMAIVVLFTVSAMLFWKYSTRRPTPLSKPERSLQEKFRRIEATASNKNETKSAPRTPLEPDSVEHRAAQNRTATPSNESEFITLTSTPPYATVFEQGIEIGKTPMKMSRFDQTRTFVLRYNGYRDATVILPPDRAMHHVTLIKRVTNAKPSTAQAVVEKPAPNVTAVPSEPRRKKNDLHDPWAK